MCLGMLCFLSLGIACAVYANSWGKPPSLCEDFDKFLEKDDICDSVPLTTTNSLQAVSEAIKMCLLFYFHFHYTPSLPIKGLSFLEIGVFGAVFVVTIFSLCSRSDATTTTYDKI